MTKIKSKRTTKTEIFHDIKDNTVPSTMVEDNLKSNQQNFSPSNSNQLIQKPKKKKKQKCAKNTLKHAELQDLSTDSIQSTKDSVIRKKKKRKIHEHLLQNFETNIDMDMSDQLMKLIEKTGKKKMDVHSDNENVPYEPNEQQNYELNESTVIKQKKRKKKHKDDVSDFKSTYGTLEGKSSASTLESTFNEDNKLKCKIKNSGKEDVTDDYVKSNYMQLRGKKDLDLEGFLQDAIRKSEEETERMLLENKHIRTLRIVIEWELPPSHRIETSLGTRPTREQNAEFKKLEFPMKKGPFTKEEDDAIQNNFKEFCEQHNIRHDPAPFMNFVYAGKSLLPFRERLKFAQYIGKGLNDRKLYTIYTRFQLLHMNVKKGKFSIQEDNILLDYIRKHQHDTLKFSNVAKILNRSRVQIQKRYYAITQLEPFTRIPTHQKVEELVSSMMTALGVRTVNEMKGKKIEEHHWRRISALMDDTPVYELKTFWRLSVKTRLFNRNIKIDEVLRTIIEDLHQQKVKDWKQLNWSEIAKPFKHKYYTSAFLYAKFKDLKRFRVPKEYHNQPRICIRMLRNLYKQYPTLFNKVRSYKYVDGTITKV